MSDAGDLKPSRESLREVRREFKQRKKAQRRGTPAPAAEIFGWDTPRRRARVPRVLGAVVVAACLGLTAVWFVLSASSSTDGSSAATPPLYPAGVTAGPSPAPSAAPTPTPVATGPVDPFAGSPVAAWLVGADAVVPPTATAVGRFSTAQVGDAYAKTRAYVLAAFLDPKVVYGGDVTAVATTLAPENAKQLRAYAASPTEKADPTWYANRFFGADVTSAVPQVRVNGSMTAALSTDEPRLLEVSYTYAFVYAVRPAAGGVTTLVSVRRDGSVLFDRTPGKPQQVTQSWNAGSGYLDSAARCHAGPQHPGFLDVWFDDPPGLGADPATAFNPLDLAAKPPNTADCYVDTSGL